jgi:hypothetical protein
LDRVTIRLNDPIPSSICRVPGSRFGLLLLDSIHFVGLLEERL